MFRSLLGIFPFQQPSANKEGAMKKPFIIGLAIIMAMYLLTGSILAD